MLKEKRRALEGGVGYLRTMFHYVVYVAISQTHLLCAGNCCRGSFLPRKHIYLSIKESIHGSNQTHKIVLLNQQEGLFPFSACTMWFLEVAYFLAQMLKSTEGRRTECRSDSSLFSLS